MKISIDWLKDYVDVVQSPEEVSKILSNLGFPTEQIEYIDGDAVIDLEVTSNRGDCLSIIGVARELAAFTGKKLKLPSVNLQESENQASQFVDVEIADRELCGRYTARVIERVKVGPAPEWMRKRLEAVGIRSVNNVVDATNYAMMETGQPPHAFDYAKLLGGKIIVRRALEGERLVSIDGTKCELSKNMLIIADTSGPVAIAGVMGGLATEISDTTTTVLLEEAHFDPVSIRTTGRRLGLKSEASFRFERKVDIEMLDWASKRCAQLIIQVAGGTAAKGVVDAYPAKRQIQTAGMRFSRLRKILGFEIPKSHAETIFSGLGLEPQVKQDDLVVCTVPTWRHDIYREADLIEEIARSYGLDKIPVEKRINIEVAPVDRREQTAGRVRAFLNGCGFFETINVTFTDERSAKLFADQDVQPCLAVKDESGKSVNLLRQSLVGSLLAVMQSNYRAGNIPCRIFELADTFRPAGAQTKESMPVEKATLALAANCDFSFLRSLIEGLLGVVAGDSVVVFEPVSFPSAKAAARVIVGDKVVGKAAVISETFLVGFDLDKVTVSAAELDFDVLLGLGVRDVKVKPIPKFPAIVRDLSLIVDEHVRWADITAVINKCAPNELESIKFSGIYRGRPIESGRKSVTVSLCFRDDDGTLKHEFVDKLQNTILDELIKSLNALLRTV